MLAELETGAFGRLRPLLEGEEHNLSLTAVAEGRSPGRSGRMIRPTHVALALTPEGYYLIGAPPIGERADAVKRSILNTRIPEDREHGWGSWGVNYPEEGWEELLGAIFADLLPLWDYQRYFVLQELRLDWREGLPNGLAMERVTAELLGQSGLENVDDCRDWAEGSFGSIAEFERNGFGFCLVQGGRIASWCLADCVVGHRAEIGIQTDELVVHRAVVHEEHLGVPLEGRVEHAAVTARRPAGADPSTGADTVGGGGGDAAPPGGKLLGARRGGRAVRARPDLGAALPR